MTDRSLEGVSLVAFGRLPLREVAVGASALAALYFLPSFLSDYWLRVLISVAALVVASLSVGVLFAQLGMVSLAQYGLLGVGGWFALRMSHGAGAPFELALLAGGAAAALVGLIVGLPVSYTHLTLPTNREV